MISVCIPVYNFDVTELISQLLDQQKHVDFPVEILVIDDDSTLACKKVNSTILELVNEYIELDKNIGRSAIRNRFLKYSNYTNLLFLDCDGLLISDNFLKNYYEALNEIPSVVVGGREYGVRPNDSTKLLRWSYGKFRESRSLTNRLQQPYESFLTNNFMIDKELFLGIKFDESLIKYGHEDTLFGFELESKSVPMIHIDNPVLNNDLENAEEYLAKTKEGIYNLYNISVSLNHDRLFVNSVKLLKYWKKSNWYSGIITSVYSLFSKSIESNLLGERPSLRLFDLFKLNELICLHRKHQD